MSDLAQALHDEAALMRNPIFGRTPFLGFDRAFADFTERLARRVEGHDVTAEFLARWEPYFAREDAEREAERERRYGKRRKKAHR